MCGLKRRYLIAKVQFVNELIFENIVAKSKIFLHLLILFKYLKEWYLVIK